MLVDIFRAIAIGIKFVFYDLWVFLYKLLFKKQNQRIKMAYQKRIHTRKKSHF